MIAFTILQSSGCLHSPHYYVIISISIALDLSGADAITDRGHILLVDNHLMVSLKSTRELSNCRPLEFVLVNHGAYFLIRGHAWQYSMTN